MAILLLAGLSSWSTDPLTAQEARAATGEGGGAEPSLSERSVWTELGARGLTTLGGSTLEAGDLAGRWVLLDFWATWCAPCIAELPTLRSIHERFPADRLLLLGVSMNSSSRASLRAWLHRQRVDWPQVHEGRGFGGRLAAAFGVDALPRTVLVDPSGRIVAVDLRGAELIGTLETLIPDL